MATQQEEEKMKEVRAKLIETGYENDDINKAFDIFQKRYGVDHYFHMLTDIITELHEKPPVQEAEKKDKDAVKKKKKNWEKIRRNGRH